MRSCSAGAYLDYAATAPIRPEVLAAMEPYLRGVVGNPASGHRVGRHAREAIERAREQVARLVNADPATVVFTSGGTEADNLAVKGALLAQPRSRRHLVVSAVEHHAVLEAAAWAQADAGAQVDVAPVDGSGVIDMHALADLVRPGATALVALMAANNEVGAVQPVRSVADQVHAAGALLVCDAVQAAGTLGVDSHELGADLLALSAHKLGGPVGVGALVVARGVQLRPLLHGGGQERGLRAGTTPVALIVGFGAAAEAAAAGGDETSRLEALRQRLLSGLTKRAPELCEHAKGASKRLPGLLSVRFPGRLAEDVLLLVDREEIACSAGAACASGAASASHVVQAMGFSRQAARETIRLSMGYASTAAEVDRAVAAFARALDILDRGGSHH